MERTSQEGEGMSQVSGQWRVGDGLQRWGGYRSRSQALKGIEMLVYG